MLENLNYTAILVASVVMYVAAMLYYGPIAGKKWMKLVGFTKADMEKAQKEGMAGTYLAGFVTMFITATVLALLIEYTNATTAVEGAKTGLLAWFGFIATGSLGMVLWENKPFELYVVNNIYSAIQYAGLGAIIAVWI